MDARPFDDLEAIDPYAANQQLLQRRRDIQKPGIYQQSGEVETLQQTGMKKDWWKNSCNN